MNLHSSLVSVDWLMAHLEMPDLIVLNASIPKITDASQISEEAELIPHTRFFDLKNKFSKQDSKFPNTVPSANQFQEEAQNLGINANSKIVVYDDLGIYSSPRAWWLFKLMGFENVAVLDGGLPAWKNANFPLERPSLPIWSRGNFISDNQGDLLTVFETIQSNLNTTTFKIIDARFKDRFLGLAPEPRKGLRSGHIPNSFNLPYSEVIEATSLSNASTLQAVFNNFVKPGDSLVFTCGSGVTACILALAADVAGFKTFSVYDGSWTEYGSLTET